jgi:hypothetical protein
VSIERLGSIFQAGRRAGTHEVEGQIAATGIAVLSETNELGGLRHLFLLVLERPGEFGGEFGGFVEVTLV